MILPDVRGLHPYYEELALRFAERGIDALAIDWFGRTAGPEPRGDDFDHMPEVAQTTWAGISADIVAGRRGDRLAGRGPAGATVGLHASASAWAAGCRSWPRRSGSTLAGVIGAVRDAQRARGATTPRRRSISSSGFGAPVLGLFGGADTAISADAIAAFDAALSAAGVDHRIVTYPGAPHSFFDRKAAEFADASAAAWSEILAFIAAHTAVTTRGGSLRRRRP